MSEDIQRPGGVGTRLGGGGALNVGVGSYGLGGPTTNEKVLFWASFLTLIAAGIGFSVRGAILGDSYGILKLLVHAESRELLGVHVFGTNATELVHIGQMVMGCGGTVDFLVDAVFNYPTLAESYKVAALDAVNKMRAIARVTQA